MSSRHRRTIDWAAAGAAVAVASGIGAVVYVAGVVATWIRFDLAGFPADIAVAHQSRTTMIIVGAKGVIIVTTVGAVAVTAILSLGGLYVTCLRKPCTKRLHQFGMRLPRKPVRWLRRWWTKLRERRPLRFVLALPVNPLMTVTVIIIAASAFWSWRWFGVSILVATCLATKLDWTGIQRTIFGPTRISLLLASTILVAAISWQFDGEVQMQGVYLFNRGTPIHSEGLGLYPTKKPRGGVRSSVPYFGETTSNVYVGVIKADRYYPKTQTFGIRALHRIREVPRAVVELSFAAKPIVLYSGAPSPARTIYDSIKNLP